MESLNSSVNPFYSSDLSYLHEDWPFINLFTCFVILSFVVSVIAVVGNAIIMNTMMTNKKLRDCSIFSYIMSIAVSDIVQGILPAAMALEALRIFFSWVSRLKVTNSND